MRNARFGIHSLPSPLAILLILVTAFGSGACRSGVPLMGDGGKQERENTLQRDLRLQLELFSTQFTTRFQDVVDEVLNSNPDPHVKREVLTARLEVVPTFRALLEHPDARIVYLDMWAFCEQLKDSVDDRENVGPGDEMVDEVAADLVGRIRKIGETFLKPEVMAEVEKDVANFAQDHSMGQRFTVFYAQQQKGKGALGTVGGIVSAPLGAINPFGGIDATAAAIHSASDVGDRFATIVERLPDTLRWEVELVMHDFLTSDQMTRTLENLDNLNETAAGFETAARTLPEDVTKVLQDTESTQESLRLTLQELNTTLEQVAPLLTSVERTTQGVADAGRAWEGTTRAVHELVDSFGGDEEGEPEPEPVEPAEPSKPFDILDYAETAEALTAAAAQLTTLVGEVRGVVTNEELGLVTEAAGETVNSAVDHVVFRVIELVVVLLAAIVLLRVFWNRTRPAVEPAE